MAEYYGVQRSNDYLKHYGIRGMKWGVRKAIYEGNDKKLESHYRKAAKKLAKLEDIGNNPAKYAGKSMAYGVAAAGTGTLVGPQLLKGLKNKIRVPAGKGRIKRAITLKSFKPETIVGTAATAGLAALSGVNAYRAANAKKYRAKAAKFRSAMNDTFAGTKYDGLNGIPLPKNKKKRR